MMIGYIRPCHGVFFSLVLYEFDIFASLEEVRWIKRPFVIASWKSMVSSGDVYEDN